MTTRKQEQRQKSLNAKDAKGAKVAQCAQRKTKAKANAGISPLRCAPVEMTFWKVRAGCGRNDGMDGVDAILMGRKFLHGRS